MIFENRTKGGNSFQSATEIVHKSVNLDSKSNPITKSTHVSQIALDNYRTGLPKTVMYLLL